MVPLRVVKKQNDTKGVVKSSKKRTDIKGIVKSCKKPHDIKGVVESCNASSSKKNFNVERMPTLRSTKNTLLKLMLPIR